MPRAAALNVTPRSFSEALTSCLLS